MNVDIAEAAAQPGEASSDGHVVPRYSWYVLALLAMTYLLAALDRSIVSILIEPIRAEFNLNDSQLGFVAGLAFGIPCALMAFPFGLMIDRVSRKNFLTMILGLWSVLTALGGFAHSYIQLVLSRMAVGAAEAGVPAAHSIVTDYFSAKKRPMALGLLLAGGSTAYLITFALGGWVAASWGWRYAFFVVGAPGLVISSLIFFTVREPARGIMDINRAAAAEAAPPLGQSLRYLFSLGSFLHLFMGYALVSASISSFWSWIGSLLVRVHGLSIHDAGLDIGMCAGVGACMGSIFGAMLAGRLGARSLKHVLTMVTVAAAAAAPLGITMSLVPSVTVVLLLMPFVAGLKTSHFGPTQGIMLTLAKARMRGVTAALCHITGTLIGFGVGPMLSGVISHVLGGGIAIRVGLATVFILDGWAAVHFWIARQRIEADLRTVA